MKTRVTSICNYLEIPFEPVTEIITRAELEDEISNEIRRELLSRRTYAAVSTAQQGDIATLRLESENKRYNKDSIRLNLGLGLFDRELEKSVEGRSTGDLYETSAGGCAVKVTVVSLERKVSAELSDGFVRSLGIEDVSTVEEYREHLAGKYLNLFHEAYVEYHAMDLFEDMISRSDIELSDDDAELFITQFAADIDDPDDREAAMDDAVFVLELYLADCIARGVDYRRDEELPAGSAMINELRDRVLAPLLHYLDDKVELVLSEEE